MRRPTCQELGFCQSLAECPQGVVQDLAECHLPCSGPTGPSQFPFAPGVIDGPAPVDKGGWIADLVAVVIALGAVAAVVGFAVGYMPRGVL
jgi:hypothetical protein